MDKINYRPIGKIRSSFKDPEGTPIQPTVNNTSQGKVILKTEFQEGLKDLEDFSHIILLYHCHKSGEYKLTIKPFMEDKEHGIFSIRAPSRPNSIGLSIVKLREIKDNILYVDGLDILDKTPLLDIKPYVPQFDRRDDVKIGWLEENVYKLSHTTDDGRFSE